MLTIDAAHEVMDRPGRSRPVETRVYHTNSPTQLHHACKDRGNPSRRGADAQCPVRCTARLKGSQQTNNEGTVIPSSGVRNACLCGAWDGGTQVTYAACFRLRYTLVCRLLGIRHLSKHPGQPRTPRTPGHRDREEAQLSQSSFCSTHPCWYYKHTTWTHDCMPYYNEVLQCTQQIYPSQQPMVPTV